MRYICTKSFEVYKSDDNGSLTDESVIVEIGSEWEVDSSGFRICGDFDTVRLENISDCTWLEISRETVSTCFTEVEDSRDYFCADAKRRE